jgi:hypothetical protein
MWIAIISANAKKLSVHARIAEKSSVAGRAQRRDFALPYVAKKAGQLYAQPKPALDVANSFCIATGTAATISASIVHAPARTIRATSYWRVKSAGAFAN